MIIHYDNPGQLCNRIWSLVPSIAKGIAEGKKVLILNFNEYSHYFEHLNKEKKIVFKANKPLCRFLFFTQQNWKIYTRFKQCCSKFLHIQIEEGFDYGGQQKSYIMEYQDRIRAIFDFSEETKIEVDTFLATQRTYDTLVGVHIRKGDYIDFAGGAYYFNDEVYKKMMLDVSSQLELEGKKVGFLLCSNESSIHLQKQFLNSFVIPHSSGIKDLYALSRCSYIIGPPSTFSQWASFYGQVPAKYILSEKEEMKLSAFSPIVALDRFKNDTSLWHK